MSILTAAVHEGDEVFAAFASGHEAHDGPIRSVELPGGNHALVTHGVTVALRSDETVVFDALPHPEGQRCVCRYMRHIGRAGVHVHELFADDEVHAYDHQSFVALAARLEST